MAIGIAYIFGVLFGALVSMLIHRKSVSGVIRVDQSDPYDGPYLFLELTENLGQVVNKKYVTLQIDVSDYISQ